jgi:hypothetical protein
VPQQRHIVGVAAQRRRTALRGRCADLRCGREFGHRDGRDLRVRHRSAELQSARKAAVVGLIVVDGPARGTRGDFHSRAFLRTLRRLSRVRPEPMPSGRVSIPSPWSPSGWVAPCTCISSIR